MIVRLKCLEPEAAPLSHTNLLWRFETAAKQLIVLPANGWLTAQILSTPPQEGLSLACMSARLRAQLQNERAGLAAANAGCGSNRSINSWPNIKGRLAPTPRPARLWGSRVGGWVSVASQAGRPPRRHSPPATLWGQLVERLHVRTHAAAPSPHLAGSGLGGGTAAWGRRHAVALAAGGMFSAPPRARPPQPAQVPAPALGLLAADAGRGSAGWHACPAGPSQPWGRRRFTQLPPPPPSRQQLPLGMSHSRAVGCCMRTRCMHSCLPGREGPKRLGAAGQRACCR